MDSPLQQDAPQDVTLVHGVPTLQRPPFEPFGHAWVEFTIGGQVMVRDRANGHDFVVSIEDYYQAGKIDPAQCQRYTLADLRRRVTETGHWGPWED